jgi:D-glycero-alpha-D-manno-heptose 1-phosphate guanylyltransferase
MPNAEDDGIMVVILAGGAGTRVAHLLPGIPKPMAQVMGRPFLDWIVEQLTRYGFRSFLISTGHLGEVIEEHVAKTKFEGAAVQCVRELKPCGTAGGFLNTVQACTVPRGGYLVVNGDSMVLADARLLAAAARRQTWDAALFGLKAEDARRYGLLEIDARGLLKGFREKGASTGVINVGAYWIGSNCLDHFPKRLPLSFEHDVFPALIAGGARVGVVNVEAPFIDIGTPASMNEAEAFIAAYLQ